LGQNDLVSRSSPIQVPGTAWPKDRKKFTIGNDIVAAVKTDGTLWSWGSNAYGGLGHNNRTSRSSPTQIPGTNWDTVSGSSKTFYATKTDGTAWGWGNNQIVYGGFPLEIPGVNRSSPIQIPGTDWAYIRSTLRNTFATKNI